MAKTFLEMAGDHVLVADMPRDTTIDGITLPDNIKEKDMVFGLVVSIGPKVSGYTKPEDRVCYGPYAGKEVALDGVVFRIMVEDQIEAYVRQRKES